MCPCSLALRARDVLKVVVYVPHTDRAKRVYSQKSNWRESVLHCSHVCRRQREQFLTPNRGKAELIGWGPRSAAFLPDACSHMGGSAFGATAHDGVHDAFMTLTPYTRTSEGEVHS